VKRILLWAVVLAVLITVLIAADPARADVPLPDGCTEHVSLAPDPEVAGDVRCAGLFLEFHLDGVAASPRPLWAGQWAVTTDTGEVVRGWCVHHRGVHPLALAPAVPSEVRLPLDPGGRRSAHLLSHHAHTADPLTAAALWAVFHWYAQDAAGSARSRHPEAPLVPSLDVLAGATGRADLQDRALALAAQAEAAVAGDATDVAVTAWYGTPAWPDPHGVQPLLAAAAVPPETTTTASTSPLPTSTTVSPTTTTTTVLSAVEPPPTDPPATTTTTVLSALELPPTDPPATTSTTPLDVVPPAPAATPLPSAGGGAGPAPIAAGFLAAGAGLVGAARRRLRR
jgi:hypothetical protein